MRKYFNFVISNELSIFGASLSPLILGYPKEIPLGFSQNVFRDLGKYGERTIIVNL